MNISVFGLGYVGAVSCACFSKSKHNVIGVDISQKKIDLINNGRSPIIEKDLEELIGAGVKEGNLKATIDEREAILNTDLSLICVGTPSQQNGDIDLSYIFKVCSNIAHSLKEKESFHTVVIRSTVAPGTIRKCGSMIEEISGKKLNESFGVVSNPEFLREGSAIYDFYNPPYTVIGASCEKSGKEVEGIYQDIKAPVYMLRVEEAELIKYTNNYFHALKVSFANEIGNICKELGVDGHNVMDIVANDKKLNLSPYYLKPGFAFGGSCLPKDVRSLSYKARSLDIDTPILNNVLINNEYQIKRGIDLITNTNKRKIGVLGFAFKAETDDLRESPIVTLIESLLGKGYELAIYDSNVLMSKLLGKNKDFIIEHLPHIVKILKDSIDEVIKNSEVIVIGNNSDEFKDIFSRVDEDQMIIDFVRIDKSKVTGDNYVGICW